MMAAALQPISCGVLPLFGLERVLLLASKLEPRKGTRRVLSLPDLRMLSLRSSSPEDLLGFEEVNMSMTGEFEYRDFTVSSGNVKTQN
jgi:hypothetical protein